jgi:hypothetical protein
MKNSHLIRTILAFVVTALAFALSPPAASGRPGGAPGPMTGTWKFIIQETQYEGITSKPSKHKLTITFNCSDSAGDVSPVSMSGLDDENNLIQFNGSRAGLAFQMSATSGNDEIFIAGTISKPGKDGHSKMTKGNGVSLNFPSTLVGTSDGSLPNGIGLFTFTGQRQKDQ